MRTQEGDDVGNLQAVVLRLPRPKTPIEAREKRGPQMLPYSDLARGLVSTRRASTMASVP